MEFTGNKAIYLQIAELLMDNILSGALAEGERMPSVREYAGEVEVNVNTVVRSFDWLAQREVIFQRRGLGFFVSEGAQDKVTALRRTEFFSEQLPQLFQSMQALGIGIDEIVAKYSELLKK